jgi:hypothetical protein
MIVLNLVLRISDTIKKHLSPSIDERAVNVWYNSILRSSDSIACDSRLIALYSHRLFFIRFLLFAGRKGHIAMVDCMRTSITAELQLQEEVHDVQFLHNETMFAVAQNKYTYIYDQKGVEIHCMRRHERPYKLDFLPYHYLLTSVGHSGMIKWHDVSTGEYVAGYQTKHGPAKVLKHNPINAVSHVGHSNGVVTLWSPASGTVFTFLLID